MAEAHARSAKLVRLNDNRFARRLAHNLAPPRQITVWDVLLPFLFIFSFVNAQRRRELLCANYLFTKSQALDAAKRMLAANMRREDALEPTRRKMEDLLRRLSPEVYSQDITVRQMAEIDFLLDHYCGLLTCEGEDYGDLVRRTYPDREAYAAFQTRLRDLEREVVDASKQAVGESANPEFIKEYDDMVILLRNKELSAIYGA